MTTSSLFHVFGLRNQELISTKYIKGETICKVKTKKDKLQCSSCNSRNIKKAGTVFREFKAVPVGFKPIKIQIDIQRLTCKDCGITRQEHLSFAEQKKSYTRSFKKFVLDLVTMATIKDVADNLNVSWDLVKGIQKKFLKKRYSKIDLSNVKRIGIDEFAIRKGHKYMTIVVDLDTGRIIYAHKGRDAKSLDNFWKLLKKQNVNIEAVATDMSIAYISAVFNNISKATLVFDRFHIIKNYNDILTKLRRLVYNQETNTNKKKLLKGTRWLLLKNEKNLNEEKDEKKRLEEALLINRPIAIAYYLKEDLKLLWEQENKKEAKKFLGKWIAKAYASGVPLLYKFAGSLLAHRNGIFNWYDYPISTGQVEGINNKIKVMKRQAYGYRDIEFFMLKLFGLHLKKYALIG